MHEPAGAGRPASRSWPTWSHTDTAEARCTPWTPCCNANRTSATRRSRCCDWPKKRCSARNSRPQQLVAYRIDYQARWAAEFSQGATMQILLCYRSFMQRLDQAVKQQAQLAEQAGEQVARARAQLLQREQRAGVGAQADRTAVRRTATRRPAPRAEAHRRTGAAHAPAPRRRRRPRCADRLALNHLQDDSHMMNSVTPRQPVTACPSCRPRPTTRTAAADGPAAFAKALDRAAQARRARHAERARRTAPAATTPSPTHPAPRSARQGARRPQRTRRDASRARARPRQPTRPADEARCRRPAPRPRSRHRTARQGDAAAQALLDLASLMAGLAQAARGAADDRATAAATARATTRTAAASRGTRAARAAGEAAAQADAAMAQDQRRAPRGPPGASKAAPWRQATRWRQATAVARRRRHAPGLRQCRRQPAGAGRGRRTARPVGRTRWRARPRCSSAELAAAAGHTGICIGAGRPGQRADPRRRVAGRAAPEPGRHGPDRGADPPRRRHRHRSTSAPRRPRRARPWKTPCRRWPAPCASPGLTLSGGGVFEQRAPARGRAAERQPVPHGAAPRRSAMQRDTVPSRRRRCARAPCACGWSTCTPEPRSRP